MKTEHAFTLPVGYVAPDGAIHREGVMRLATARDEIEPLRDASEQQNREVRLVPTHARVVTRIGDRADVTPQLIEGLYAADFDHLQRLYERLNTNGDAVGSVACPACAHTFEVDLSEIEDGGLGK